jgi:hypothetical protein
MDTCNQSQVMVTKNDHSTGLVNGSRGVVTGFQKRSVEIRKTEEQIKALTLVKDDKGYLDPDDTDKLQALKNQLRLIQRMRDDGLPLVRICVCMHAYMQTNTCMRINLCVCSHPDVQQPSPESDAGPFICFRAHFESLCYSILVKPEAQRCLYVDTHTYTFVCMFTNTHAHTHRSNTSFVISGKCTLSHCDCRSIHIRYTHVGVLRCTLSRSAEA